MRVPGLIKWRTITTKWGDEKREGLGSPSSARLAFMEALPLESNGEEVSRVD